MNIDLETVNIGFTIVISIFIETPRSMVYTMDALHNIYTWCWPAYTWLLKFKHIIWLQECV